MRLNRILIVSLFLTVASVFAAGWALTSTPGSRSFGKVTVGKTSEPTVFTVTNSAKSSVAITGVTLIGVNPTDYKLEPSGTCKVGSVLSASDKCTVVVKFSPKAAGTRSASVRIDSVRY